MTAAKQGYRGSKEQQCGDGTRGTREGDGRTGLYARTCLTVMHVSVSSLTDTREKVSTFLNLRSVKATNSFSWLS